MSWGVLVWSVAGGPVKDRCLDESKGAELQERVETVSGKILVIIEKSGCKVLVKGGILTDKAMSRERDPEQPTSLIQGEPNMDSLDSTLRVVLGV